MPGNGWPVSGSMIGWIVPFVIRVCEKSPRRSSSVGRLERVVDGRSRVVGVFLRGEEVELPRPACAGAAVDQPGDDDRAADAVAGDIDP